MSLLSGKRMLWPLWCLVALTGQTNAQPPALHDADRIRLAEAFRLADSVRECVWPGWGGVPFAVLLVTPDHEYLLRHPRPSGDFTLVAAYDSLLQTPIYARERGLPPNLLATFPAVGGLPTVVVGRPEQTGRSSTRWVITLLHEHFHQLQYGQPDYYEAVGALDLSGGDQTGMWMLNYAFPYPADTVGARFRRFGGALSRALSSARGADAEQRLREMLEARAHLREAVSDADYRYLSFQLWQEGVARYVEIRVAEVAAERHEPSASFRALEDFVPYARAAESLRSDLAREMASLDLASAGRIAFYPVGASEALLLDVARPGWKRRYFVHKFDLEHHSNR